MDKTTNYGNVYNRKNTSNIQIVTWRGSKWSFCCINFKKTIDAKYWWAMIFKDVVKYCKGCDICQIISGMKILNLVKLVIMLLEESYMKWGLDFMGPIKPIGRLLENKYKLMVINLAIKWVETWVFQTNITIVTTKFIYESVNQVWISLTLVTNYDVHFINDVIKHFTKHFLLKHVSSRTYYPHGNKHA